MQSLRPLVVAWVLVVAQHASAQRSLRQDFFAHRPEALPIGTPIRIVGADRTLTLQAFDGFRFVSTPNGAITVRRHTSLGRVGTTIDLDDGVYALSADQARFTPAGFHPRAYRVTVTEDVVAIHVDYADRRWIRRGLWFGLLTTTAIGGALFGLATNDAYDAPDGTMNRKMFAAAMLIAFPSALFITIPLFIRDDARIDVEHADGRIERARRRVRR